MTNTTNDDRDNGIVHQTEVVPTKSDSIDLQVSQQPSPSENQLHKQQHPQQQQQQQPMLRNLLDHDTVHGSRAFELWQGDITTPGFDVDILVVSYVSRIDNVKSVANAIESRYGWTSREMANDPNYVDIDLRQSLGTWISKPLKVSTAAAAASVAETTATTTPQTSTHQSSSPFQRILGIFVEHPPSTGEALNELLSNLFATIALCDAKNVPCTTVAMPIIGTGGLGISPEFVLKMLLPLSKTHLERSYSTNKICFFAYQDELATKLDQSMNELLGRSTVKVPKRALVSALCTEISTVMKRHRQRIRNSTNQSSSSSSSQQQLLQEEQLHRDREPLLRDWESVLERESIRAFEIGILGRRLAEVIVFDLLGESKSSRVLARNIEKLRIESGYPDWIIGYFHLLRHLGNESAHESHAKPNKGHNKDGTSSHELQEEQAQKNTSSIRTSFKGRNGPDVVGEGDLVVNLSCVLRVWEFWMEYSEDKSITNGPFVE